MAFRQPCDTYFVESSEASGYNARTTQEQMKEIGRRRQMAMTDELSRQADETYMEDIIEHMHVMENQTLPDVASIDIQQEIQWFMRPYLIDFLVEAHAAFQLLDDTLYLAVNLLDRYCSRRVVYKRHYQLVGCAALLIAAKYGDKKDRVPLIKELKSMCCGLYDEEMFTQMEWHVLNTLDWSVGHPTVDTWIQLAVRDNEDDVEVENMALYLNEIALYHKDFIGSKPSVMASASLALARGILCRSDRHDKYSEDDNLTMLYLSQKLDKPSQILMRKHASPHLSSSSIVLDNFLRHQEAMNRRASPPTPPCENVRKATADTFPGTPQKPNAYGTMAHGYMTPPITPEGECFAQGQDKRYYGHVPRCPVTPTPQHHNTYLHQAHYQSYQADTLMH
ncbi:cyclin-like protein [Calycina marina]|uniref:Cyclin-like protein n=1 Tax=Calycina marina TaxID=1763456 RepID=A0A9P8CBW3_9HELO|nr:cyclin-like protein [Calycina marina]